MDNRHHDATKPNGIEFDCLYLDMNGLVSLCHPEEEALKTEHICLEVFKELDHICTVHHN